MMAAPTDTPLLDISGLSVAFGQSGQDDSAQQGASTLAALTEVILLITGRGRLLHPCCLLAWQ